MHQQSDLFDPAPSPAQEPEHERIAVTEPEQQLVAPLAAPCGYLNCRNQPCRRSALRPLLLDGVQLIHRGVPLLLCDPLCWRDVDPATANAAVATQDNPGVDDIDHDDPGPEGPPDYDEWAGWERADDDGFDADGRNVEEAEEEGRGAFRLMGGTGL